MKERNTILSFMSISNTLTPRSIPENGMQSVSIDVIGTFCRALSQQLVPGRKRVFFEMHKNGNNANIGSKGFTT